MDDAEAEAAALAQLTSRRASLKGLSKVRAAGRNPPLWEDLVEPMTFHQQFDKWVPSSTASSTAALVIPPRFVAHLTCHQTRGEPPINFVRVLHCAQCGGSLVPQWSPSCATNFVSPSAAVASGEFFKFIGPGGPGLGEPPAAMNLGGKKLYKNPLGKPN